MRRPYRYTLTTYETVDVDQVAVAQAITALTPMTLLAPTLDIPRPITIVSAADESDNLFHIVGTGPKGGQIRETIAGVNAGTAESRYSYASITSVTPKIAGSGNVSLGIATLVPTPWHPVDPRSGEYTVNVLVTGTLVTGYNIQGYHGRLGHGGPVPQKHRGEIWDIAAPIDPAEAVEVVATATVSARTVINGQFTALRLMCEEALDTGEKIVFEVLEGFDEG